MLRVEWFGNRLKNSRIHWDDINRTIASLFSHYESEKGGAKQMNRIFNFQPFNSNKAYKFRDQFATFKIIITFFRRILGWSRSIGFLLWIENTDDFHLVASSWLVFVIFQLFPLWNGFFIYFSSVWWSHNVCSIPTIQPNTRRVSFSRFISHCVWIIEDKCPNIRFNRRNCSNCSILGHNMQWFIERNWTCYHFTRNFKYFNKFWWNFN